MWWKIIRSIIGNAEKKNMNIIIYVNMWCDKKDKKKQ